MDKKEEAMRIVRIFTAHPESVGETYASHFATASRAGFAMLRAGLACLVHAALPFLFVTTASQTIRRLYERLIAQRQRA